MAVLFAVFFYKNGIAPFKLVHSLVCGCSRVETFRDLNILLFRATVAMCALKTFLEYILLHRVEEGLGVHAPVPHSWRRRQCDYRRRPSLILRGHF